MTTTRWRIINWLAALWFAFAAAGCATYKTPGSGVSIPNLEEADADIKQLLEVQPASPFPARVAVVGVQSPGYQSLTNRCSGGGQFCVVTTRDVEPEAAFATLSAMPEVADLALMNRLILPSNFESTRDLRRAAATLKTDLLLVYSIDTGFNVDSTEIGPLALISLGLLPNKKARVTSTASAAIFDVRTGFLYGVAESSTTEEQRATIWTTSAAIDTARRKAETTAFQNLVGEIEKLWTRLLKTHLRAPAGNPG